MPYFQVMPNQLRPYVPLREYREVAQDWLYRMCSPEGREKLLRERQAVNERQLREPVSS